MLNGTLLIGFTAAALVVLVIPGPGVVYVVARSLAQGRKAGLVSVTGLAAGAFLHVIAAAIGLSAILLASSTAFSFVKLIGAGYLIYLGIRALLTRSSIEAVENLESQSFRRLFVDGVIISAFNPKIAIFFLAFLPQFVDASLDAVSKQILLLGVIYVGLALTTDGAYALFASSLRRWVSGRLVGSSLPRYLTGGIYILLGINAALVGKHT